MPQKQTTPFIYFFIIYFFCVRTLLHALDGGGGPGHTEIFIGPNMHRVQGGLGGAAAGGEPAGAGGGGGGGGGLGAMLGGPGGLGFLLRGFGMAGLGGGGGGMGPGGNVGDYAFGDLSQLIQQLMAADTNRVRRMRSPQLYRPDRPNDRPTDRYPVLIYSWYSSLLLLATIVP